MATSGNTIALALEIDDKGTATIKNFAGQYEAAMNKVKASTTAVGSVMQRLGGFSSSVGARFSGLIRTLTSLKSLLLGGLGIYSITSVLKDFVAESNNADRATVGLITSLKATGRYTAEYAKKLFDLSSAYQATSTFGDEAIQDTMKMLATFKKISDDQIPRATRAIMDISTLMGTDMASAARLVGRASEGMAEGLSRVGIIIDDDVAKSGDFTKILDAIEAKVHGQSEELRKTGYGGLVAFGNIVGDVKEKLGDLIKSAIYPFVEAMIDGVNDINNNLAAFAANDDFEQRIISIQEKMRDWAVVALESVLKIKQSIAGLVYWIEQHPTIVEMGIVGYFLWGKKGIAGAAGVGVLANSLDRMKATWKGVMSGKVGLWDWILMDREEAEKTIADMNVYVKKSADEIDRLAASGTISAQSARELKEELQGISSVDLDTLTAQPDMFDNLVQGLIDKLNNMKLVAGKSGIDVGKSIGEGISGGVGEAVEDTTDKIKEMAESVYAAELTPDMQQALDDYYTAQEKVSDRIMELKSSETDYQLYLLDKEIDAFADAGVDKARLDELYQLERQKIMVGGVKDTIAQERELYQEYWESMAGDIKAAMSDTLVAMWEGETEKIGDIWEELWHRVKKSYADIAIEGISDAFAGVLDWMGLDSLSKAFKTTKTPANLEVLDKQYDIQKLQLNTLNAMLEKMGGTPVASATGSLPGGIGNTVSGIGDLFGKLFGSGSKTETATQDYTDAAQDMCMATEDATKATEGFGSKLSNFFSSGGTGGKALGVAGAAQSIYGIWNGDYTGSNRWEGAGSGMVSGAVSGAEAGSAIAPGIGTAIGAIVGGVSGLVGGFLGGEDAEKKAKMLERAYDLMEEFNEIMEKTYSSTAKMAEEFDEIIKPININAYAELVGLSAEGEQMFYSTAQALRALNKEAAGMGSSVGTMRRLQTVMEKTAIAAPEQAEDIGKMLEKMQGLFRAELFADFEKGILDANTAIKELIRTGMSQMQAEVELLGEDYADLTIMLQGSIEAVDLTGEAFNALYASLDEFDTMVEALPDTLKKAKKELYQLSYAMRYLLNMNQSFISLGQDWESVSASFRELGSALASGDLDTAVSDLNALQMYALEASSAVQQLADAVQYLGNKKLAAQLTAVSKVLAEIAALFAIGLYITQTLRTLKDLTEQLDRTIDKFDQLQRKINRMTLKDLLSDFAERMAEVEDIIKRADFGDIFADMDAIFDEFTTTILEMKRLYEAGLIFKGDPAGYFLAQMKVIKAFQQQIEDYFDAILDGFKDLSKSLRRDILGLSNTMRPTAAVNTELVEAYGELGAIDALKDPDKYLEKAGEIRDLIMERYDLEKQRIEEAIAAQEDIKAAYQSVVDTVTDMLFDIQSSGLNPETATERLTYYAQEADRLRGLIATETDPTKRAGYQSDLAGILQNYLKAAEEVYQRPSNEYQAIYQATIDELGGLRTDAQEKIGAADAEIIRLQGEMKTLTEQTKNELIALKGNVDGVTTAIQGVKELTINNLGVIETNTGNTAESSFNTALATALSATKLTNLETLFKERFPLASFWSGLSKLGGADNNIWTPQATGIDYVPRDNYPAMLHKGEAVVRARENKTVNVPINFSISVQGGSGKQIVADIEREIKWGKLGQVIKDRVKYAA